LGTGCFDQDGSVAEYSTTLDSRLAEVSPMFRQPFPFIIGEVFKIKDGKIRQIEAMLMASHLGWNLAGK
jgi:hypothetical protein